MTCNLERYLIEQELQCARIGQTCDEGSLGRAEWLRTAQMLSNRRFEHTKVCEKCSKQQMFLAGKK